MLQAEADLTSVNTWSPGWEKMSAGMGQRHQRMGMTRESAAQHPVAELLTTRHHPADFTASRAEYTITRLRLLALGLAVLLPLWIPVDYWLLNTADFLVLAGLRLVMAVVAIGMFFYIGGSRRLSVALGGIALLLLMPAALYVAARLMLESSNNLLYGYAFFPVLIAALLAVFPLTLLEGAMFGLPLLLGYGGLELVLAEASLDPQWLGMLWLLALVTLVALMTQLSQLRMLLDLYRRATRDTVTGVFNRHSLVERLQAEFARWEQHERPLGVLMVRLTALDAISREHGAPVANRLMAQLAEVVGRALRPTDLLGRWNDSSLIAVLPETDDDAAQRLALRVREVSQLASVTLPAGQTVRGEPRVVCDKPSARERLEDLLQRLESKLMA